MAKEDSNRRSIKNALINRGLQIEYLLVLFLAMFVVSFSIIWDISISGRTITAEYASLYPLIRVVNSVVIAKAGIIMLFVLIMSVLLSHKIAGPVYHFQRVAQMWGRGDLTSRINLRHGDNLQDTARIFNEMIDGIRDRVGEYRAFHQRIQEQLRESIQKLQGQKGSHSKEVESSVLKILEDLSKDAGKVSEMFKI